MTDDVNAPATSPYRPRNHVRIVTAASLFDGHDVSINLMRRILQSSGAEVIHLGHNRSVDEIVDCAIQEDAQAIAVTSYQGGHVEYLQYMVTRLTDRGAQIQVFAGGGGTILPSEADWLHARGVARVYSPDDGRALGLQGMINDLLQRCDVALDTAPTADQIAALETTRDPAILARLITLAENEPVRFEAIALPPPTTRSVVLGITGTGGAGKSSLVDELVRRTLQTHPEATIAILSVDPSKRRTGGALLGDRIRMNAIHNHRIYMRSLATRQSNLALSKHVRQAVTVCKAAGFDLIILETSGIGQSDTEIVDHCDCALYVMTADYGAATQLEKIDMIDYADAIAINKFEKRGSEDALRDVRKQYRRAHQRWTDPEEDLPIVGTVASAFADEGTNRLHRLLMRLLSERSDGRWPAVPHDHEMSLSSAPVVIVPPTRERYLADIADENDRYAAFVRAQSETARRLYQIHGARCAIGELTPDDQVLPSPSGDSPLAQQYTKDFHALDATSSRLLQEWPERTQTYRSPHLSYQVRGRTIEQPLYHQTLSGQSIPRVALPRFHDWGDILRWRLTENLPGEFPFSAGVFPLKRPNEDPIRMFAGEGGPERTNRRFHYLSRGMPAKRLSTAFDSVTLYGEDPDHRPDIFGKIGNSGVSVANLDEAKRLYSGFDLTDPQTSVSMTINGPAPILLSFFLNAAIDQQCERWLQSQGEADRVKTAIETQARAANVPVPDYAGTLPDGHNGLGLLLLGTTGDRVLPMETYTRIKADTLAAVRGTVQADILKEDQAQNTCIFSTEFALRMMGDIQASFITHGIKNFYSVSVSGYHIAEAGANPITQLAFTLANGFTLIEYYLSRGMHIDAFAPSLSFFFSNGLDPEYTVIGRVARRIWAKAIKFNYGGNARSQRLKYHIQTSGRSLHAQEIAFNDIRTTLQALIALQDHCNSLHTNAYDEAITTPTEESVRRAVAIQLIIAKELGLSRNENPLQGSFIIEELSDIVEAAVLAEFRRLSDRGGVLGAMERMYQRTRIQEESMLYEGQKHSGELPIIGVNTFLDPQGSPTILPAEVTRSSDDEKQRAITHRDHFWSLHRTEAPPALETLQTTALQGGNTFDALLEAGKVCSLGQLSSALYQVGGQYRRSM